MLPMLETPTDKALSLFIDEREINCSPTYDPAHLKMGCPTFVDPDTVDLQIQQPNPTSDSNDLYKCSSRTFSCIVLLEDMFIEVEVFPEANSLHLIVTYLLRYYRT